MLARVQSYLLEGIDAKPCEVEVDLDEAGLEKTGVVGLPDAGVKESLDRVRAALLNSGYRFPQGRVLVNLAPADVRKEGPTYDLPMAVGLLMVDGVIKPLRKATGDRRAATGRGAGDGAGTGTGHSGQWKVESGNQSGSAGAGRGDGDGLDHRTLMFGGELALDGRLRPIKGVIALASLAREKGATGVVVPWENADEASVVPGLEVFGARTLSEVVGLLNGEIEPAPHAAPDIATLLKGATAPIDFAEVRGQEAVKRAMVIAAAGNHNLLMLGPAGTGKTMMAKALPGILPPLTVDEALEVTRIYSAAGALPPGQGLITTRPVRSPHHTASSAAIVGGGMIPRPGEISLAHHGVLFLDELAEFPRFVLETLRQPLEDHVVTIARAHGAVKFPTSFMLIAAMNPTPKGDVAPGEVGKRAMESYLAKLSGPLLDRVDIHVEAPAVPWKQLSARVGSEEAPRGTDSATMRAQVLAARTKQYERQRGITNARLSGKQLDQLAKLDERTSSLLGHAISELGLSARAYDKIRRVARTIADVAGREDVSFEDVSEAIGYRLLDRKV